jgi:hypothetical protein
VSIFFLMISAHLQYLGNSTPTAKHCIATINLVYIHQTIQLLSPPSFLSPVKLTNSWTTLSPKPHASGVIKPTPLGPIIIPTSVAKGGSDKCSLFLMNDEKSAYTMRKAERIRYVRCGPVGASCFHSAII